LGTNLRVGVAGATGSVGRELLTVLDAAPWRPDTVVPMASARSTVPFVEYGDRQVAVEDLAVEDLAALDALFVALPRAVAGPVVDRAAQAGVPVVDLSGSQLEQLDVPLALPWLTPEALERGRARDVVTIPSATATLLASILGPLAKAGWSGSSDATVLLPASFWGRDAVDELSRQVTALFTSGSPPRKVFPHGLAFDLLPLVGEVGSSGWTAEELRTVAEVARLTGLRTEVALVGTPVFSGVSADVRLAWPAERSLDELAHLLDDGGVPVTAHADPRRLPRPRRVEGQPFVHVARVRRGLHRDEVRLWASMDNLRTAAVAAVGAAAVLLGQREGE
jgi:aspartate-semialdehyde dehydrogenase